MSKQGKGLLVAPIIGGVLVFAAVLMPYDKGIEQVDGVPVHITSGINRQWTIDTVALALKEKPELRSQSELKARMYRVDKMGSWLQFCLAGQCGKIPFRTGSPLAESSKRVVSEWVKNPYKDNN